MDEARKKIEISAMRSGTSQNSQKESLMHTKQEDRMPKILRYRARDLQMYTAVRCSHCGWRGLSKEAIGGDAVDVSDRRASRLASMSCPVCHDAALGKDMRVAQKFEGSLGAADFVPELHDPTMTRRNAGEREVPRLSENEAAARARVKERLKNLSIDYGVEDHDVGV